MSQIKESISLNTSNDKTFKERRFIIVESLNHKHPFNVEIGLFEDNDFMIQIEESLTKVCFRFEKTLKQINQLTDGKISMDPENFFGFCCDVFSNRYEDRSYEIMTDNNSLKINLMWDVKVDLIKTKVRTYTYELEFKKIEEPDIDRIVRMMKDITDYKEMSNRMIKMEQEMKIIKEMLEIKTSL